MLSLHLHIFLIFKFKHVIRTKPAKCLAKCLAWAQAVRHKYAYINSTIAMPPGHNLQGQFSYTSWLVASLSSIVPDAQNRRLKRTEVRLKF